MSDTNELYDIFIIGGGVNGTSIARDASGRNLKVGLCEKKDIGWATSSASTKLLHGGLRYLEYFEFRLVREALEEREILFNIAPHISWRMRFIFPYVRQFRPAILIRIGLFMYDHLAKLINIQKSRSVNLTTHKAGLDLDFKNKKAFEYSDLGVLDSKFCLLNARGAKQNGADIFVRTELMSAKRNNGIWEIELEDKLNNTTKTVHAKTIINTTGPWTNDVIAHRLESKEEGKVHLVKGSHIVVPKLYEHDYCYILQNNDKRIVFAIPYEEDYTMIGTTDVEHEGVPETVACSDEEREYLCNVINKYFKVQIKPSDIAWDFAGVRPLYSDGKSATSATRDYVTKIEQDENKQATLLNLFGGKITAAREIGEKVMNELAPIIHCETSHWTRTTPLIGGDFQGQTFEQYMFKVGQDYSWLQRRFLKRLVRHYGTEVYVILGDAKSLDDLGIHFGYNLYEKEVQYLMKYEWVTTANDLLRRRTRLILHINDAEKEKLQQYIKDNL